MRGLWLLILLVCEVGCSGSAQRDRSGEATQAPEPTESGTSAGAVQAEDAAPVWAPRIAPRATDEQVKAVLLRAAHCEVSRDCVGVGDFCPIGCNLTVHRDHAPAIRDQLKARDQFRVGQGMSTCDLDCEHLEGVDCRDGICVAIDITP